MAESEFWPNGARLAITMSLMFESGGEVRPDSGALGPLFPIPMPLEIPDLPTETYFQYGYLEGIGAEQLALMKRSAVLLNTSRGAVVDEPALAGALEKDQIAAAGLDVFEDEPLAMDSPLRRLGDKVLLSPHMIAYNVGSGLKPGIAWSTRSVLSALRGEVPDNVFNTEVIPRWRERFGGQSVLVNPVVIGASATPAEE